ncbi:hypothetical protein CUP1801 [Campylobacter upsaliensis RM3195]|nr:hypothetical protein CUP1801 [Campylobacter upsaliensis RM3195]
MFQKFLFFKLKIFILSYQNFKNYKNKFGIFKLILKLKR